MQFTITISSEAQTALADVLANPYVLDEIGVLARERDEQREAATAGALRAAINAAFRPLDNGPDAAVVANHERIAVVPQTSASSLVLLTAPEGWIMRGSPASDGRRPEWRVLAFIFDPTSSALQQRVVIATQRGVKVVDLAVDADARYDLQPEASS